MKTNKFKLNENARKITITGAEIIGNICNGAFLVLDDEGSNFINCVDNNKDWEKPCSKNVKRLIKACLMTEIFGDKKEDGLVAAYLHLTDHCNLHCIGCYSEVKERNKKDQLDLEQIKYILDELHKNGVTSLFLSGGEPFLRSDLVEILKYAKTKARMKTIVLATNGTILREDVLKRIKSYVTYISVSIDGFDEKHCDYIRDKGTFIKVIGFIEKALKIGVKVSLLPTIHKKNYCDIDMYTKLAEKYHVPISFSLLTCNKREDKIEDYVLSDIEFSEMVKQNNNVAIEDVSLNLDDLNFKITCGAGKTMISIDANGKVYPCHMLQDDEFLLGDVFNEKLDQIMKNANTSCIVKECVDNKKECSCCKYKYFCGGGCKARAYFDSERYGTIDPYCESYKASFKRIEEEISSIVEKSTNR